VVGPGLLISVAALVLTFALCAAIGLFTSVYGAQARDVRFSLNYAMGFWYFFTPVLYPLSTVPSSYRTLMELNPMTAPMEMFRNGIFGTGGVPMLGLAATIVTIVVVGSLGLRFFIRSEAAALDNL
jgi:lipopolysaccharide transport system permease protein